MTVLLFTLLVLSISVFAGFLGSLTGLGGGIVLVPALTLLFHVDLRYAIGASLVSVIATSSGAASAYVREGYANVRIGMLLEIGTTLGALTGAFFAARVATHTLAIVFGTALLYSAYASFVDSDRSVLAAKPDPLATKLKLNGECLVNGTMRQYYVQRLPAGFSLMFAAGGLSGLLGIGSGAVKVIALDRIMRIPFKVSTTTSNFMIGVTAAASASVYLSRGYIHPGVAMPVVIGVLTGAFLGSKVLVRSESSTLRKVFTLVILVLAIEMIYNGWTGKL